MVKGIFVSVYDVLNGFAKRISEADITADFLELSKVHIRAAFPTPRQREKIVAISDAYEKLRALFISLEDQPSNAQKFINTYLCLSLRSAL